MLRVCLVLGLGLAGGACHSDGEAAHDAAEPELTCRSDDTPCDFQFSDTPRECCGAAELCCAIGPEEETCVPEEHGCQPYGNVCNPISQTGCRQKSKCAFILDKPESGAGHVGCVPNGTIELGGRCGAPQEAGEHDDCVAGTSCYEGTCHAICTTINDLCTEGNCRSFEDSSGILLPIEVCVSKPRYPS